MTQKHKKFFSELRSYFDSKGVHNGMTERELFDAIGFFPGDYWISSDLIYTSLLRRLEFMYGKLPSLPYTTAARERGIPVIELDSPNKTKRFYRLFSVDKERILPWLRILKKHKKTTL